MLTCEDSIRAELVPLLAWWEGADRPASVRAWLARRPAARNLLRGLADGTILIIHDGLDQLDDTKPVRHSISAAMLRKRLSATGLTARAARTAALAPLAVELPAAVLARCLGIDISSAVAWQRTAAGDWHAYAARSAHQTNGSSLP